MATDSRDKSTNEAIKTNGNSRGPSVKSVSSSSRNASKADDRTLFEMNSDVSIRDRVRITVGLTSGRTTSTAHRTTTTRAARNDAAMARATIMSSRNTGRDRFL